MGICRVLAGLTVLTCCVTSASADTIIDHIGSNNPTGESPAWDVVGSGNASAQAIDDNGTPAWQTADYSTAHGSLWYYQFFPSANDFADPDGWTFTARVRVVSHPDHDIVGAFFSVSDGSDIWAVDLIGGDPDPGHDGIWYVNDNLNKDPPYSDYTTQMLSMDTTSAYHWYQLVFDPAENDQVGVYVDGTEAGKILRSEASPVFPIQGYDYRLTFGAQSSAGSGVANWNYVAFETGQHVVPEPSTYAALISMALTGLLIWRRKHQDISV